MLDICERQFSFSRTERDPELAFCFWDRNIIYLNQVDISLFIKKEYPPKNSEFLEMCIGMINYVKEHNFIPVTDPATTNCKDQRKEREKPTARSSHITRVVMGVG